MEDKKHCPNCGHPLHEQRFIMETVGGRLTLRMMGWGAVAVALLVVACLAAAR